MKIVIPAGRGPERAGRPVPGLCTLCPTAFGGADPGRPSFFVVCSGFHHFWWPAEFAAWGSLVGRLNPQIFWYCHFAP